MSAQSGWNTETKKTYLITKNSWLHGSTAQGWLQSPHSFARAR